MKALVVFALLCIGVSAYAQPATAENEVVVGVFPKVTKLENGDISPVLEKLKGQVVVVNFWATWCVPCVREFPELVRLQKEYKDSAVTLVFVSLDDVEELEALVLPFLALNGVNFESYIRTVGDDQAFINGIDERWSGAIPLTLVYDREGKKKDMVFGSQHYEDFVKLVEPLL